MAEKYRSLQLLRNENITSYASHEAAIKAIKGYTTEDGQVVASVLVNVKVKDGELVLYRYKLDGDGNTIHTQVVAAQVNGSVKNFEIVANYDQLTNIVEHLDANVTGTSASENEAGAYVTVNVVEENGVITKVNVTDNIDEVIAAEIAKLDADVTSINGVNVQVQVVETDGKITGVSVSDNSINANDLKTAIEELDADKSGSNANQDITVQVVETDGKITGVSVSDTLKSVAHTGAAADVAVADAGNLIEATTVEGALAEIAKEIDDMDSSLATTDASQTTKLVKLGYTQVDGVITSLTSDETALETRLQNIENNTITGKEAIVVTPDTTTGNNEVSLKIAQGEKVLSQNEAGLTSTLNLTYDTTAKAIKLWGISTETPIATVDATDFIKDGMLADAEIITATNEEGLTPGKRYIKFTFNTYQQGQEGEAFLKVEYLDVEDLFDSYEAGNEWIKIDQATNEISHKTVDGLDSTNTHGITEAVTVDSTAEKFFQVPTLKVDAAGHVVSVDEQTVTIKLPASIDTALQQIEIDGGDYITATATKSGTTETIELDANIGTFPVEGEGQVDGLATVADVVDYVKTNSTTVSDVETNPVSVASATNADGSTNYTVTLDAVEVENEDVDNTMADATATHSYITSIETDGFGRVIKTITETMKEDIDCGLY